MNTTTQQQQYNQVKEFMTVFGQECPKEPTVPSLEVRRLRAKLILEEAIETCIALGFAPQLGVFTKVKLTDGSGGYEVKFLDVTMPEHEFGVSLELVADGLADLHYVGYLGTAIACGISNMDEVFTEVHRSNMSKLWKSYEVNEFIAKYPQTDYVFKVAGSGNLWLIKDKDGKVVKSPSYSPAKIVVR